MPPRTRSLLIRLRELLAVVAVAALTLVGTPGFAAPEPVRPASAPADEPAPPREDIEDEVPDAVHCSRSVLVRHNTDPPAERLSGRPTSLHNTTPPTAAPVRLFTSADLSRTGAGVRLRC